MSGKLKGIHILSCDTTDKAGALTDEAEYSVSDLVVGRSVRCLPTEAARELFQWLGTCPEVPNITIHEINQEKKILYITIHQFLLFFLIYFVCVYVCTGRIDPRHFHHSFVGSEHNE